MGGQQENSARLNAARTIPELAAAATALYRSRFSADPAAIGVAPGRVNLIGEHVDYEGGLVMPMAIDRWLAVALAPSDERVVRGATETAEGHASDIAEAPADIPDGHGSWVRYVVGVLDGYRRRGWDAPGVNLAVATSLPAGAGLSSSAALETATAVAMEAAGAPMLSSGDRALLCQAAEHEYAGVPCGIMDQLAVGCAEEGHALLIDCRTLEMTSHPLPAGCEILVVDTGVRHELGQSEYPRRRAECRDAASALGVELLRDATLEMIEQALPASEAASLRSRAVHVVSEIGRVQDFADALRDGDRAAIGAAMAASHDSLRDLFEVSCAELDALVAIGRELPGVIGCRMTGGGFGGSAVFLVECSARETVAAAIESRYRALTGLDARILPALPAAGAASFDSGANQETQTVGSDA